MARRTMVPAGAAAVGVPLPTKAETKDEASVVLDTVAARTSIAARIHRDGWV